MSRLVQLCCFDPITVGRLCLLRPGGWSVPALALRRGCLFILGVCEKGCTAHNCHCKQWCCNSNCLIHEVPSFPCRQTAPSRPQGSYHKPPSTGKLLQR